MKNVILILVMCFSGFVMFGQLDYETVSKSKSRIPGNHDSYVSKDGSKFTIGDTLQILTPSGNNGKFVYISKMDMGGTPHIVGPEANNTTAIIKKIKIGGTSRSGWKVAFQTKGYTFVDNYFMYIEDAIENGEIKSNVISDKEALSELKSYKDKLDLGLITEEVYNKKKEELIQYIK